MISPVTWNTGLLCDARSLQCVTLPPLTRAWGRMDQCSAVPPPAPTMRLGPMGAPLPFRGGMRGPWGQMSRKGWKGPARRRPRLGRPRLSPQALREEGAASGSHAAREITFEGLNGPRNQNEPDPRLLLGPFFHLVSPVSPGTRSSTSHRIRCVSMPRSSNLVYHAVRHGTHESGRNWTPTVYVWCL